MSCNYDKVAKEFSDYCPTNFVDYLEKFAPVLAPRLSEFALDACAENRESFVSRYLYSPLSKYLQNPGKMHRPLTMLAAYFACGGSASAPTFESVLNIALSLELFQSAALIHDDIADAGEIRRGEPCMHRVEGEPVALNAGDFALSAVEGQLIASWKRAYADGDDCDDSTQAFDADKTLRILHELTQMEYRTIEGQAIDLGWARDDVFDISVEDYFDMARRKTAYYSAAVPCVLGAMCADAPAGTIESLRNFGLEVGLSFQIRDDLLNLVGSDKSKDFRSDIVEGKRTLLVAYSLENAEAAKASELRKILSSDTNSEDELLRAVEIMKACGALDFAEKKSHALAASAEESLAGALPYNSWTDLLLDMAKWSCNRDA